MNWLLAPPRYVYKRIAKYSGKAKKVEIDNDIDIDIDNDIDSASEPQSRLYCVVTGESSSREIKIFESECDAMINMRNGEISVIDLNKDSGIVDSPPTRLKIAEMNIKIAKLYKRIDVAEKLHVRDHIRMTLEGLEEIRSACRAEIEELITSFSLV